MLVKIGAQYSAGKGCEFVVWAPFAKSISLHIIAPFKQRVAFSRLEAGYWKVALNNVFPGARYFYELDGRVIRPDPASFFQPEGVHKASQVVGHADFSWNDQRWNNFSLEDYIIYELHVGAFTPEGTFQAAIEKIGYFKKLGINAIELMPVAQFPGKRNWGYDGVYPFAVQNSYGGPQGLKKLVDACHRQSIAVILDVVYNHLGPEGNYLGQFAPYFTDKYKTPWGSAVNFDDAHSYGVRNYFVQNTLYWFEHYHIDALRLDAVHGIFDMSAKHILRELCESVEESFKKTNHRRYLIAESDLNDTKLVKIRAQGGYGLDGQWSDDFHHALHAIITKEDTGYYEDFGSLKHLTKAIKNGFVYDWEFSRFRKRFHGSSSAQIPSAQFIIFSQNHDQVGNRIFGERLSSLVSFERLKIAAGMVIFSPYIPLLFMGEEYAEASPFFYFINHSDKGLIASVREGRKREFSHFKWEKIPPDPQSQKTFDRCKLDWGCIAKKKHSVLFGFYQELIRLRKEVPALARLSKKELELTQLDSKQVLIIYRKYKTSKAIVIANFNEQDAEVSVDIPDGKWYKRIDSSDARWLGQGSTLPKTLSGKKQICIKSLHLSLYIRGE
ncbi:MAG: malto-oligosyltrehalose trehalohydrolase [Candidatus Omnitrophica bacterium]|nr:malto-oligosyltrehalose trehalohydrolase [Candidatus Omnitrophota bacterium]